MPEPTRAEIPDVMAYVAKEAEGYLDALDAAPVREPAAEAVEAAFGGPLPEDGAGALAALSELVEEGLPASVRSAAGKPTRRTGILLISRRTRRPRTRCRAASACRAASSSRSRTATSTAYRRTRAT